MHILANFFQFCKILMLSKHVSILICFYVINSILQLSPKQPHCIIKIWKEQWNLKIRFDFNCIFFTEKPKLLSKFENINLESTLNFSFYLFFILIFRLLLLEKIKQLLFLIVVTINLMLVCFIALYASLMLILCLYLLNIHIMLMLVLFFH